MQLLPVEEISASSEHDGQGRAFGVSLDLVENLRENYSVQAILMGTVFFAEGVRYAREARVISAHVKVVDVGSLEILCQVSVPEGESGSSKEEVAEAIARELSALAGRASGQSGQ